MSFLDHLEELRWVIIKSIIVLSVTIGITLFYADDIFELFIQPLKEYIENGDIQLRYKSPLSAFMIYMKMGFSSGLVISLPFILYFIWGFVTPALHRNEKRYALTAIVFGLIFFILGLIIGYLLIPIGIPFLLSFAIESVNNDWDIGEYIKFCMQMVTSFGVIFQTPVILALLIKLKLVSSDLLQKHRRIAIVLMFIFAAVLTPPDIWSQIAVAIPMIIFYEIGIIYAKIIEKKQFNK